ncbi:aldehyde dehydrogenase family protein [Klebsiella pneumoniae]
MAEVTAADSDQAERAMESARQAFSQWREMPTLARGALLLKLADTLAEHREALAQLESLCSGKTITLARMLELDQIVAFLRYFAGWAGKSTVKRWMSRCHRWPGRNIPPLPAASRWGWWLASCRGTSPS